MKTDHSVGKKEPISVSRQDTFTPSRTTISTRTLVIGGFVIVVIVLIVSLIVPSLIMRSQGGKATEAEQIITRVEKMLLLPEDKEPTVIEVEDTARLKATNEVFYQNVERGDYLLMYPDKAVIYRQGSHKIINVAPVTADE